MRTDDLETIVKNLGPDLYSFAYILIPDDLQAGQLMIDAVQNFLLRKKSYIEKILQENVNKESALEIRLRLFQAIYEIAKKRFHQIKMSFSVADTSNFFLSLEFDDKAMMYLRVRASLEIDQIEMIMNKDRSTILAFLSDARIKMIQQSLSSNVELGGYN
jgi:hypothetical protein